MPKTIFIGEFYPRKGNGKVTYRSRRGGEIIDRKPRVIVRRGKRNLIILAKGTKVLGVERNRMHFFGADKGKTLIRSGKVLNATRTRRSRASEKAMFARMNGRR